jgi:hypothetical protein
MESRRLERIFRHDPFDGGPVRTLPRPFRPLIFASILQPLGLPD